MDFSRVFYLLWKESQNLLVDQLIPTAHYLVANLKYFFDLIKPTFFVKLERLV